MSDPRNYTIGWISALEIEYVAVQEFLVEEHAEPNSVHKNDENHYTLGRIGNHNVVIAVLPRGDNGVAAAAMAAKDMMHSFPNVRVCLMVGVGGGAPSKRHDIRLGDVVVSVPTSEKGSNQGGVVQFDYAKTIQEKHFRSAKYLNTPPRALLTAVNGLSTKYMRKGNKIDTAINKKLEANRRLQKQYGRPDDDTDRLYSSDSAQTTAKIIIRPERSKEEDNPAVHYGLIASSDGFMEDAQTRDLLAEELDVLCFEMEAAGLMNSFPCLIIRGICDYSDKYWSKEWRGYAAMAAAAYATALLETLPANEVDKMQAIKGESSIEVFLIGANFKISATDDFGEAQAADSSEDLNHQTASTGIAESPPDNADVSRDRSGIKHVYIAVMGVTGAGKSSFISMCAGKNVKIGHDLKSCTADVEDVEFMLNDRVCVHLIDTPGFDDTNRSDVEVLQNIAYWLSKSFVEGTKLSGMIYLHRIIDVRMTSSVRRNILMFQKLCGEKVYHSVVLATTMWGLIDEATGIKREQELAQTEDFWGYMHKQGSRIFRVAQTRESCLDIIQHILSLDSTVVLELQDEIVNLGHQLEESKAGVQLNEDIIRVRKKYQAELLEVKEQMKEEIVQKNAELQRVLKEECGRLEENIRCNEEEQAKLKQGLKDVPERKEREMLEFRRQIEADREHDRKKYEDSLEELNRRHRQALEQQAKEHANMGRVWTQDGDDSPLHNAARDGKADLIKLLLSQGADIEAMKNDGQTALYSAARAGRVTVVELLLDQGANIEAKRSGGFTALHSAALNGHADVVEVLLERRANIEAKQSTGYTALHLAAKHGFVNVVEVLIDMGANMKSKVNDGQTALDLAKRNGKADVVKLLLRRGLRPNMRRNQS
ncbi:hypothetical protein V8C35DRAFT_327627 [Trichoderma chlorosporum]